MSLFFYIAIFCLVCSITLIVANIICNNNISILGLVLTLLGAICLIGIKGYYEPIEKIYKSIDQTADYIYFFSISVAALLFSFISLIYGTAKKNSIAKLFEAESSIENGKSLAIVAKNGRLLKISKKIKEISNKMNVKDDTIISIKRMTIDGEDVLNLNTKTFQKELEKVVKADNAKEFLFTYSNGLTLDMNIVKQEVKNNNRLLGYSLIDTNVVVSKEYKAGIEKEYKKSLFIYLDMLDEPIAYFDVEQGKYILTHTLAKELGLEVNAINKEELQELVNQDEVKVFQNHQVLADKVSKIYYRLNVQDGAHWFEESTVSYFNKPYRVLRRVDSVVANKISFGNYKGMVKYISDSVEQKEEFGIVMVNLFDIPKTTSLIGKDMTDLVISRYFINLLNDTFKENVKLFKVSTLEYAIVSKDIDDLKMVIHDLVKGDSNLCKQVVSIDTLNQVVEAEVSAVLSTDMEDVSTRDIINAALDTLKIAASSEYDKNYCVYEAKKEVELDYSLADLGIDLDNDDLSSFEEDIDTEE